MKPTLLKISDVMKVFGGVSRATVYRMIASGELERVHVGGRSLITIRSVENLLNLRLPQENEAISIYP